MHMLSPGAAILPSSATLSGCRSVTDPSKLRRTPRVQILWSAVMKGVEIP